MSVSSQPSRDLVHGHTAVKQEKREDSSLCYLSPHASSARMARLTCHHAISPTPTRRRLYRDWRARRRTCSCCSCYLTWHLRQETVVQTGSLVSVCPLGRSKSAISMAPVNQAPLTLQSRREPRSGLSLLARKPHLLHAADCSHARAPLPAHGTESARASFFHINCHAPVRRPRLLLHPFRPLAAQLHPKSSVILTRRGSTDKT